MYSSTFSYCFLFYFLVYCLLLFSIFCYFLLYCITLYFILLYFISFHIIFSHIILSRFHTQGLSNFRLRLHDVEQESFSCLSLFQIKFYFKKYKIFEISIKFLYSRQVVIGSQERPTSSKNLSDHLHHVSPCWNFEKSLEMVSKR